MQIEDLKPAGVAESHLSEVVGRYLEAIYYMQVEGEVVRGTRLAEWLGVTRPTVTVTVQRMARDGLVRLASGKTIELTPEGETRAARIVRRHRIVERWLTDWLGLGWIEADLEAARLEHAISEVVEHRLHEALGRPQFCPHGNPIPGHGERNPEEFCLVDAARGTSATLSRVSEVAEREMPPLLAYLEQHDLKPGVAVEVVGVDPLGGTTTVEVANRTVTLGRSVADKLWIVPA
jgi:DtxR family transcriptional regulator, Mn-dependent transcriptional regulator